MMKSKLMCPAQIETSLIQALVELLARKAETEEIDLNPQMPVILDFIRSECRRQKLLSDQTPDDHKKDYAELNAAFRRVLAGEFI